MSALADLATAVRKVQRLLQDCPPAHRPDPRDVFAGLDAARAEVVELTGKGRNAEAEAIVADWEHEAASRIASVLAHAPLEQASPQGSAARRERTPSGVSATADRRPSQYAPPGARPSLPQPANPNRKD